VKKTEAQKLRERAAAIRLDAYYKYGGVGVETLKAERKAAALEAQANVLSRDD
jgi:hypothetical protein